LGFTSFSTNLPFLAQHTRFIVLDRDLYQLVAVGKPEQIADTKVTRTVFRGQTVFSQ
jgi:predicted amidohydrolase YtcJ